MDGERIGLQSDVRLYIKVSSEYNMCRGVRKCCGTSYIRRKHAVEVDLLLQMSSNDSTSDPPTVSPSRSSAPTFHSPTSSGAGTSGANQAQQDASAYPELTNVPSITLPYAEDAETEGDADAESYTYPTALEPRRHGASRWFNKELRCLLYGYGDDENPYTGACVCV